MTFSNRWNVVSVLAAAEAAAEEADRSVPGKNNRFCDFLYTLKSIYLSNLLPCVQRPSP